MLKVKLSELISSSADYDAFSKLPRGSHRIVCRGDTTFDRRHLTAGRLTAGQLTVHLVINSDKLATTLVEVKLLMYTQVDVVTSLLVLAVFPDSCFVNS